MFKNSTCKHFPKKLLTKRTKILTLILHTLEWNLPSIAKAASNWTVTAIKCNEDLFSLVAHGRYHYDKANNYVSDMTYHEVKSNLDQNPQQGTTNFQMYDFDKAQFPADKRVFISAQPSTSFLNGIWMVPIWTKRSFRKDITKHSFFNNTSGQEYMQNLRFQSFPSIYLSR